MKAIKSFSDQLSDAKVRTQTSGILIKGFYQEFVFKKCTCLVSMFFLTLAYGFSVFSRTVSIDDLAGNLYTGSGNAMIAGYRWFFVVWNRLHSTLNSIPFMSDFFALNLLVLSAINLCALLKGAIGNKGKYWNYIIFFLVFTTFPLVNEVWEYTGTCTAIYGNLLFSSFALIYICSLDKKMNLLDYLICGALLTPSSSSYEAAMFLYISVVFSILILKKYNDNQYNWFLGGIKFAIPLILAVFNKFFIGRILIAIYNVQYVHNGATTINWTSGDLYSSLYEIARNFRSYILAYPYLPIGEFVFALIAFALFLIWARIRSHKGMIILGTFLIASLFFQSILQGYELPYRTAQTIQYFVAFVLFILMNIIEEFGRKNAYKLAIALSLFLVFRQGVFMNNMLQLNNQRSENELAVLRTIGYRLYSEFDVKKPVIFCGKYNIGEYIKKVKPEQMQTNINSCINWAVVANNNQNMMKEYMSYCGYDINVTDQHFDRSVRKQYEEIAKKNEMKPFDIKDMGDYILVYFGEED